MTTITAIFIVSSLFYAILTIFTFSILLGQMKKSVNADMRDLKNRILRIEDELQQCQKLSLTVYNKYKEVDFIKRLIIEGMNEESVKEASDEHSKKVRYEEEDEEDEDESSES